MRTQHSPLQLVLLGLALVLLSGCDPAEQAGRDIVAPESAGTDESASFKEEVHPAPVEDSVTTVDHFQDIFRVEPSLDVQGAFEPGQPLAITVRTVARLPATEVNVQLQVPEVEAARMSAFNEEFEVPRGRALPNLESWSLGSIGQGSVHSRTTSITIPAPGYYRVVAFVESEAPMNAQDSWMVMDTTWVEGWVFISENGGAFTSSFERSRMPDDVYALPGPFRDNGRPESTGPREASFLGTLFSWIRRVFLTGYVTVNVDYYDPSTGGYEAAALATGHVDIYFDDRFYGHEEEIVGSDGQYEIWCGHSSYSYYLWAELVNSEVQDADPHGQVWHFQCGGTVDLLIPEGNYTGFTALDTAIGEIDGHLGYSRSLMRYEVSTVGCGDSSDPGTCYDTGDDIIRFTESRITGSDGAWVAAHEYGHALHDESLGGVWSASNCKDHFIWQISSYRCAMREGFADYLGNVGNPGGNGNEQFESGHAQVGDSEAQVEGNVAALFQDLIDSSNDGNDKTAYPGGYIADVFNSCNTSEGLYDTEMNAADQFVWCLENRVNSSLQASEFPGRPDWVSQFESAAEPQGWNANDIRSTWLQNIGN